MLIFPDTASRDRAKHLIEAGKLAVRAADRERQDVPEIPGDKAYSVATGKLALALALRVARFASVSMDKLLAGQCLSPRVCRTADTHR